MRPPQTLDSSRNLAQRVNKALGNRGRRVVVSSGAGVLTALGHVQMKMRRVDVLRAFADRPELLAAYDAISLLNQLLIEVRVAQAGPVLVLDDDCVAEAFRQVD